MGIRNNRGEVVRKKLKKTTYEALSSVLPITVIVFILNLFVTPVPVGALMLFLVGSAMLIIGMGLFTMGADIAMIPLGEDIGATMTKTKKLLLVGVVSFVMGVIITIAEPDLQVLAQLVPGVPNLTLVLAVAGGVGIFLIFAIFRILFRIRLSYMLVICYTITIILSIFAPTNFVAVAFDSGGVTTGPITVPFIMAMGLGLASIRGDRESKDDSFGLVALCSIGPILAVLVLGICFHPESMAYERPSMPEIIMTHDVTLEFVANIPHHFFDVGRSLCPILLVLIIFQFITKRYHKRQLLRVLVGLFYTFSGLVMFMTGVNVGFIPMGQLLGADLVSGSTKWLLVPLGALIGYFIVAAEPAVYVLKKQVEEVSLGAISGAIVQRYLSVGVAISLAVAMLRVLTGISIYWLLIPGYISAIILTRFVPKIFVGIAFDSGGVVSGPMTSTFLLPFAIGACQNPDRIMFDAFGLVAMVALTPLIAIQLMGISYNKNLIQAAETNAPDDSSDEIIEYEGMNDDERQ